VYFVGLYCVVIDIPCSWLRRRPAKNRVRSEAGTDDRNCTPHGL